VVPARNDAKLLRQAPALGQDSSGPGMMYTELFGFEIEQIATPLRCIANNRLVFSRVSNE